MHVGEKLLDLSKYYVEKKVRAPCYLTPHPHTLPPSPSPTLTHPHPHPHPHPQELSCKRPAGQSAILTDYRVYSLFEYTKTINDMKPILLSTQSMFKQIIYDFGICILAFICFIIIILVIAALKYIKNKNERELKFFYDFVDFVYSTIAD
jgi:hypothetical protein